MRCPEVPAPLVVILGPTAVGKTELSIRLAERFDGEILSCDSRQFYRGMDIGTAKPTADELARVRHHLIDAYDPDQPRSLADFQSEARAIIADIHKRGKLPLLVGGTGQYVRAVIEDWQMPEQEPDHRLRMALEHWAEQIGKQGLHDRLRTLDPLSADRIQASNVRRTIRALEVILGTGRRFSEQQFRRGSPYSLLKIGLTRPRAELYARIDTRIDQMMRDGLVDEVRGLLEKGYSPDLSTFSAIGYREIIAHLRGEVSVAEAVVLIKRNTREFVRRQANWFKESDASIHWLTVGDSTEEQAAAWIADADQWSLPDAGELRYAF